MLDRAAIAWLKPGLERWATLLVRAGIGADSVTVFAFALADPVANALPAAALLAAFIGTGTKS